MKESLQSFLEFALETAVLAGKITLQYYQTNFEIDLKTDGSEVTIADRQSETLIRERIQKYFPDHALLGEEFGMIGKTDASHRWIIDPIDGTRSFVRGVPLYGVLIGLEIDGRVEVGVAHFPALNETLSAASGSGCLLNQRVARVSGIKSLSDALVLCNDPEAMISYGYAEAWERIAKTCRLRRGWGDAYGYLLVATGRAELMIDPIMNIWDCGPFPVILREAGGYFGDLKGNQTILGNEAMATSLDLLQEVLKTIRGEDISS